MQLPVVAVALPQRQLDAGVLALRLRRRRGRHAVVEAERLAERALAGVGDEVLAARRHQEVLDHAAEVAVDEADSSTSCRASPRIRRRTCTRRCTGPSGSDRPVRPIRRAASSWTACRERRRVGGIRREVVGEGLRLAAERADVDVLRDVLVETAVVARRPLPCRCWSDPTPRRRAAPSCLFSANPASASRPSTCCRSQRTP